MPMSKRYGNFDPNLEEKPDRYGLTQADRDRILEENKRRGVDHLLYDGAPHPPPRTPVRIKPDTTTSQASAEKKQKARAAKAAITQKYEFSENP